MKIAKLSATFPGIDIGDPLTSEGTGCNTKAAISRAIAVLLKSPELKRKRIVSIDVSIDIETVVNEKEEEKVLCEGA